ncbi:MAG: ThuA domain-containing protein [Fimbriiglobus sp.]
MRFLAFLALAATAATTAAADPADKLRVLIVDGQNNHAWKATTPVLKSALEDAGRFAVDVATTPPRNTTGFRPKFTDYQVVVSNYNGAAWPAETRADFEAFVKDGGGLVVVHAADNAFPEWPAYNEMIGVGGWGGRSEKSGPYVRFKDGKAVLDTTPGRGGSHGKQHPFVVDTVAPDHPITKGLPVKWKHASDELYDRLRGPAKNLTVLAVSFSDKATGGSGETEPVLFTIDYGKGRVFHTTMGHSPEAMRCAGFQATLQRGTEWAATGNVTLPLPKDLPSADEVKTVPAK